MRKKALYAYAALLLTVFLSHLFSIRIFDYMFPFYMLAIPIILRGRINFSFSARPFIFGLLVSFIVLVPFYIVFSTGKTFTSMSINTILIQLFAVSFPEEVFFRGFLQDVLRNDIKGVFIVSLMFSVTHLPGLLFYGDIYAPMTFFPSVVMGLLYMKTSNVLPSTTFHFLANVVFLGVVK